MTPRLWSRPLVATHDPRGTPNEAPTDETYRLTARPASPQSPAYVDRRLDAARRSDSSDISGGHERQGSGAKAFVPAHPKSPACSPAGVPTPRTRRRGFQAL